jgi:hypothetical protein
MLWRLKAAAHTHRQPHQLAREPVAHSAQPLHMRQRHVVHWNAGKRGAHAAESRRKRTEQRLVGCTAAATQACRGTSWLQPAESTAPPVLQARCRSCSAMGGEGAGDIEINCSEGRVCFRKHSEKAEHCRGGEGLTKLLQSTCVHFASAAAGAAAAGAAAAILHPKHIFGSDM